MGGPGITWPLIGRDEELAVIAEAIDGDSVAGIVVSGPAGVGKSRVIAEASARAVDRGSDCKRLAATASASAVPLGSFGALLPEIDASPAAIGLIRKAGQALVDDADGPLVLAVDDAHLLDDLSAALVHHLMATRSAFVIAGIRSAEPAPDAIRKLWKDGLAERLELSVLSREQTVELLEAALGSRADGGTRQRIWDASAGNPLYLRELVIGALDAGALAEVDGIWRWTGALTVAPRLAELLEERLAALADAERAALEVVAIAEPAPAAILRTLVDEAALERAGRHGLLESSELAGRTVVRLSHPLYGELLRARTSGVTAASIKRRLADALAASETERRNDALRIATWRLEAGAEQEPGALLTAARNAAAGFEFKLAERLARAAVDAGGGTDAAIVLADTLIGLGEYDEAELRLRAAAERSGAAESAEIAIARGNNLYWHLGRAADAIDVLDAAEREIGQAAARDTVTSARASFLLFEGRTTQAIEIASPLIAEGITSGPAAWQAGMTIGWGDACAGRLERSIALLDRFLESAAERPEEAPPFAVAWLLTARFTALCFAGRFERGITEGETAYARAVESRSEIGRSMHAFALGWTTRMRGTAGASARWLREAVVSLREVDMFRQLSSALGELAHAEALLGNQAAAEAALSEARAARVESFRMDEWAIGLAAAAVAAGRGETSSAVELARATAAATGRHGQEFMRAMSLYDALRYGAADVAGDLRECGERIDGGLAAAFARHAEARESTDPGQLASAAENLERIGAWLYSAECAAEAARGFRDAGREASARSWAARSAALAARCEGAKTVALESGGETIELTEREREIATMAAHRLSNREIAERLVVSVRTVENHLRSAYGKLGVGGREELAPVLGVDRADAKS